MGEIGARWKKLLDKVPLWTFLILPAVLVLGTLPFDRKTAAGLFWTFLQGETAIKHWLKHGCSLKETVAITTACSTYDLFFWFVCFDRLGNFVKKFTRINIEALETEASFLANFYRWLKKRKLLYVPLLFFGCVPGFISPGIVLCQTAKLNQPISFVVMAIGNFFKMLGFGRLAKKIGLIGIILTLVAFALLKLFAEKIWKLNRRKK